MRQIVLLFILFSSISIFGQNVKKISLLIDGGITYAIPYKKTVQHRVEHYGPFTKEFTSGYSYSVEFLSCFNFRPNILIISGLNFHKNKFDVKVNYGILPGKAIFSNTNLQIPVMVGFKIFEKFSFAAGPYLSFLISANEKGETYYTHHFNMGSIDFIVTDTMDYDKNLENEYQKYDIGISTQIAYEYEIKKGLAIVFLSRFNYGLLDQFINENQINSTDWTWKNINLVLGIGIKY